MKHQTTIFLLLMFFATSMPSPSFGQASENTQLMERMERLNRDVMLLQRQVARGGVPSAGGPADLPPVGGAAQLEVRLSGMETELRELRGKVEENDNRVRKLSENLEKLQKDTDFRFNQLPPAASEPAAKTDGKAPVPQTPPAATESAPPAAESTDTKNEFATPRDHYNYAFRLLNQTQYEAAAASFDAFTKKHPKDPLVGNAYYWQGETYYIRRDFVNAADSFRQGYESLPEGPKAADNLLKLAMSLDALNRSKEACVVLQQITNKFKKSASNVLQKTDQEYKRIGCK